MDDQYTWCGTGSGIRIYIVDTGVLTHQAEFSGRYDDPAAAALAAYLAGKNLGLGDQCWEIGHFDAAAAHGTAIASIAAGDHFGVAKGATIVDARAENCLGAFNDSNTTARMTAVLDWIARLDGNRVPGHSVVNISSATPYVYGNPDQTALAQEISSVVNVYNIPVVVAAGNFADNTYWYSPINAAGVIGVGGLHQDTDTRWCVTNNGMRTLNDGRRSDLTTVRTW